MDAAEVRRHLAEIAATLRALPQGSVERSLLSGGVVTIPSSIEGKQIMLRGASPRSLLGALADIRLEDLSDDEVIRLARDNVGPAIRHLTEFQNTLRSYDGVISAAIENIEKRS